MNLSEIFIRRPVATLLLMFGILIAGGMGYRLLPVAALPTVDYPTISVSASLAGASPETMATSVATPLEKEFSTIPGLDSMTSSNRMGSTRVTMQFDLSEDIDAKAQDVQSAIARVQRRLPEDMGSPPSFRKANPEDAPVYFMTITSKTLRLSDVTEYAENFIAQRLSMVSGVAQVQVYGSRKFAVRVQADPQALAARGVGIDEVGQALRSGNVNLPVGTMAGPYLEYTLQSSGKLMDAAAYRPLIVAWRNGAPVRLEEIARVTDGVENERNIAWYDGSPSISLAIQRQPGTNTVAVVDAIKEALPALLEQIPESIEMSVMHDSSISIRASVDEVKFTMVLTVCLVVLVIFLFLRNLPATLIPSLALPLSIIGSFAVMYSFGFSLNNLSMMGLTLSVGLVVDDAIVMLENVVRHIENGQSPMRAALDGSREIGFTIISMTISLAAVFIPVLFMSGIIGRLFYEFSVTVMASIIISGFVSLTLTPMLCSRFLSPAAPGAHEKKAGRLFTALLAFYSLTLKGVLRVRFLVLLLSFGLFGLTGWLFMTMPKGFMAAEDTNRLSFSTEGIQGSSFENMVSHQLKLMEIAEQDPAVLHYMSSVGSTSSGNLMLQLRDSGEREHVTVVAARLREKFAEVPGVRTFYAIQPPIRVGGSSRSLYQFALQSLDTELLYANATAFAEAMGNLPEVKDVGTDLQIRNPEVRITIDRDKASSFGITAQQLEDALAWSYGTREVSTIRAATNTYQVILSIDPAYQRNPDALNLLYVRSPLSGQPVPLSTLVSVDTGVGPMTVNHSGQFPSVTVSFNVTDGVALGDATLAVQNLADAMLPSAVTTSFMGTAQVFQDSFSNLWLLLLMAVVVIYIVLGMLYESFIHPLTILSGLPAAGMGALLTLAIFGKELDIYAFVGIIMLIGIVKKNAIMMIDFALEAQRHHNLPPMQAIVEGALIRFRPILMTTMAAFMGTLPIALGHGAGSESRQPLGLAVVGGLVLSQLLTLYLTPVYYVYLDALQERILRLFRSRPTPQERLHGIPAESSGSAGAD